MLTLSKELCAKIEIFDTVLEIIKVAQQILKRIELNLQNEKYNNQIKNPENIFKSRLDRDEDEFSKPEDRPKENIKNKKETKIMENIEDRCNTEDAVRSCIVCK